jgi:hypothetical protein
VSAAAPAAALVRVRRTERRQGREGRGGERAAGGCPPWFASSPTRKPAGPGRAGPVEGRALGRRVLPVPRRPGRAGPGLSQLGPADATLKRLDWARRPGGCVSGTRTRAAPARQTSESGRDAGSASESRIRVTWSDARGAQPGRHLSTHRRDPPAGRPGFIAQQLVATPAVPVAPLSGDEGLVRKRVGGARSLLINLPASVYTRRGTV